MEKLAMRLYSISVKELSLFLYLLDPGWPSSLLEWGRNDTTQVPIWGPRKTCIFISLLSTRTLYPPRCESARAHLAESAEWLMSYAVLLTTSQPALSHGSEVLDCLLPANPWASPAQPMKTDASASHPGCPQPKLSIYVLRERTYGCWWGPGEG